MTWRPDTEPRFPDNILGGDEPTAAGIVGVITVITHHIVFALRNRPPGVGTFAGEFDVRFWINDDRAAIGLVDVSHAFFYLDSFAGKPDDALDVVHVVEWRFEDNDIAALRFAEEIGQLVDDNALVFDEIGLHTGTIDDIALDRETQSYEDYDGYENEDDCFTECFIGE